VVGDPAKRSAVKETDLTSYGPSDAAARAGRTSSDVEGLSHVEATSRPSTVRRPKKAGSRWKADVNPWSESRSKKTNCPLVGIWYV